jgi:uncharacterized membrane protein
MVILVTLIIVAGSFLYEQHLERQRTQAIAQLVSMPQYENCRYDETTCPQSQDTAVLPDAGGMLLAIFGVLIGAYLFRSDATQRAILQELGEKRQQLSKDERRDIILSVLTPDEGKIVKAVIEQPGISQATLRLRTDMSKAKLSVLLKELERRGIITKTEDGKTNTVQLKREL